MNIYELEDFYLEKRQEGMDISEIRDELEGQKIPEEQIRVIIRSIDNKIIQNSSSTIGSPANRRKMYGTAIILASGGLLMTSYYYNVGGFIILPFGPMVYGIYLLSRGEKWKSTRKELGKFRRFRKH